MAKKVEDEMESASLGVAVSFQELGGPSRVPIIRIIGVPYLMATTICRVC